MFHKKFYLKEGAFVLTDAHYSKDTRAVLLDFFSQILEKRLQPTQIILLGDIFDALFGSIVVTEEKNRSLIEVLNKISKEIEIIYFEGNHDFNLKKVFPNIAIIPLKYQPLKLNFNQKVVYFSHGDFSGDFGYKIYTRIIRNGMLLQILNFIDHLGSHFILKKLYQYLSYKKNCTKIQNFSQIIFKRNLEKYHCDYFVDGHFHQHKKIEFNKFIYINLDAFACNQRYFIVKSSNDKELFEEKIFS